MLSTYLPNLPTYPWYRITAAPALISTQVDTVWYGMVCHGIRYPSPSFPQQARRTLRLFHDKGGEEGR